MAEEDLVLALSKIPAISRNSSCRRSRKIGSAPRCDLSRSSRQSIYFPKREEISKHERAFVAATGRRFHSVLKVKRTKIVANEMSTSWENN